MAPELTDNPDDRSRLFFTCTVFDGIGGLAAVVLPVGLTSWISWWRDPLQHMQSCNVPTSTGRIDLRGCSWKGVLSESRAAKSWTLSAPAQALGLNVTTCTEHFSALTSTYVGSQELVGYCDCRRLCTSVTKGDNSRGAYFLVGCFFGLWYVCSMLNCAYRITERSQKPGHGLAKPAPLVASSLRTFNNRPFNLLLPAWVCDALVNTLIQSLLTYFVRYM